MWTLLNAERRIREDRAIEEGNFVGRFRKVPWSPEPPTTPLPMRQDKRTGFHRMHPRYAHIWIAQRGHCVLNNTQITPDTAEPIQILYRAVTGNQPTINQPSQQQDNNTNATTEEEILEEINTPEDYVGLWEASAGD